MNKHIKSGNLKDLSNMLSFAGNQAYLSDEFCRDFVNILANIWGIKIEFLQNQEDKGFFLASADITRVFYQGYPSFWSIIFTAYLDDHQVDQIINSLSNKAWESPIILVCLDDKLETPNTVTHIDKYHVDAIVITVKDLKYICARPNPCIELRSFILKEVNLLSISPFRICGPVDKSLFLGREAEVTLLSDNIKYRNFAVTGNRKIGKTSLLRKMNDLLNKNPQFQVFYLDCQIVHDETDFYRMFEQVSGYQLQALNSSAFINACQNLVGDGKRLVFLVDEADYLVYHVDSRSLQNTLRAISEQEIGHFIFCGCRELHRQLRNIANFLYNFAEEIILREISKNAIRKLLVDTLKSYGVEVNDQEVIIDLVWDLTGGFPCLVQHIGKRLIELASNREARRVSAQDILTLKLETDFSSTLLENIWGIATPLEKLITLLCPSDFFDEDDIVRILSTHDIHPNQYQLFSAIDDLVLYSILVPSQNKFYLSPKAFRELLIAQDTARLIEWTKREIKRKDEIL